MAHDAICDRHGGRWGDDLTCERCTFEDGNVRPENSPGPMGPGKAITPDVVFNMDLANGPTTERFCYEAADVLGMEVSEEDAATLDPDICTDDRHATPVPYPSDDCTDCIPDEFAGEIADEWTSRLFDAGYYVTWDAGDVVVYDLRPLSEDDRETFFSEMENM